jgi:hypothetical protein
VKFGATRIGRMLIVGVGAYLWREEERNTQ